MRAAQRWARSRQGGAAFAVMGADGRIRGLRMRAHYPSASVVKAMLLVAVLRQTGRHPLSALQRRLLGPMITVSDNLAADPVFGAVGPAGLQAVARAAHMRSSVLAGALFEAQVTAAEQAWGIAPVARARRFRVFYKGGWRTGIAHQVALLERAGRRMAPAVLTRSPTVPYGEATIAGVAARVLSR